MIRFSLSLALVVEIIQPLRPCRIIAKSDELEHQCRKLVPMTIKKIDSPTDQKLDIVITWLPDSISVNVNTCRSETSRYQDSVENVVEAFVHVAFPFYGLHLLDGLLDLSGAGANYRIFGSFRCGEHFHTVVVSNLRHVADNPSRPHSLGPMFFHRTKVVYKHYLKAKISKRQIKR